MDWNFIEKYYPNYYSCDEILLSDILKRKLDNEEILKEDEEMILEWNLDIKKELENLETKFFDKANKVFLNLQL